MADKSALWIPAIRLLAFSVTLTAAILMGINHEKGLKYLDLSAFLLFMIIYSIASVWNFFIFWLPKGSPLWRLVLVLEWVVAALMVASCTGAMNNYMLMKYGVALLGWNPQCCIFPAFCNKVLISLVFGYLGLLFSVFWVYYSIVVLADPYLTGHY